MIKKEIKSMKERKLRILLLLVVSIFVMGQAGGRANEEIALIILLSLIAVVYFVLYIWAVVWSYKDCNVRGGGLLWIFTLLFFLPIGWLIYLLARPNEAAGSEYGVNVEMPNPEYQPGGAPYQDTMSASETVIESQGLAAGGGTMEMSGGGRPDRTVLISERDIVPVTGWLIVTSGDKKGERFDIRGNEVNLGRGAECEVVLDNDTVSKSHAKIRNEDGKYILYDLASRNGTFLNDKKISKAQLRDGDEIALGELKMVFKCL
jgi:FHA domain-containing protein